MAEKYKIILFVFALVVILSVVISLILINVYSRNYWLTGTDVNIDISKDGSIDIREDIGYKFKGCYREVYRNTNILYPAPFEDVMKWDINEIKEPFIYSLEASCIPECKVKKDSYEISGNFGSICDSDAIFLLKFIVLKGIVIGSDVAEFHYKIWGEEWNKPLSRLNGEIILPEGVSRDSAIVYFNPKNIVRTYSFEGNRISFSTKRFNNYLEVRILMPKEAFLYSNDSAGASERFLFNSELKKEGIIKIQDDYSRQYKIQYILVSFFCCLYLALLIFIPIMIYRKYGREPETAYKGIFEREPVKGIKPYVANSLCAYRPGSSNNNAITATLLDLVRRKHIKLDEVPGKKKGRGLVFEFMKNSRDTLTNPEQIVYDFFKGFSKSERLVWNDLIKSLKERKNALKFIKFQEKFRKSVTKSYELKRYFESKGDILMKIFSGVMLAATWALIIVCIPLAKAEIPTAVFYSRFFPIFIIYLIILLLLPARIFGRFTKDGYDVYLKLRNFRKFMTDMTLLKEYPPKSIIIWDQYLVYAAAFGVADKVINEMKIIVPEFSMSSSSLYPAYHIYAISAINSSYSTAMSYSGSSGSGVGGFSGGGGVGGGFGGGGGGAR